MNWPSFSWMRGEHQPREWMRWAELVDRCTAEGMVLSTWDIRKAVRAFGMPEKRYGHYRYTVGHLEAVRAYAAAEGLIRKELANV